VPPVIRNLWKRFATFEERALLILMRANYRHDTKFRMGILGFIPLLLFYMIYGLLTRGGNVRDPLAPLPETQAVTNFLLGMAMIILPFTMLSLMQTSKSWPAAWVFFTTSYDRVKMICAINRLVTWILIIPIGVFLCGIFTFIYANLLHALLHTIFLILVAVAGLTLLSIFNIRLPFAVDIKPGNMMGKMVGPLILAMAVFGVPLGIVGSVGYGGYLGWVAFIVAAIVLNWLLGLGRNSRIRKVSTTWEFPG
jgi:hypothetical protein